jgi:hypothetical protein
MHDTMTVAFDIKYPWGRYDKFLKRRYHSNFITIWHKDPERDGSDDSCGWFMRSRHGNPEVLDKIVKRFEFDWDRVFQPAKADHDPDDGAFEEKTYFCGLFKSDGDPNMSVQGIVLNLFFTAAGVYFESDGTTNWNRARKWMRKNLLDIILFAENPSDSLFDGITRKFEKGCGEVQNPRRREERIRSMASCIYAWILRREQKWWQHPRWHIHHWRIQVHPLQNVWKWLFTRCSMCGKGFGWNESPCTDWNHTRVWHSKCDRTCSPTKDAEPSTA